MKPILIIDCDPDFRRLLSQLLQREGYLVIQASNLNDARRILVDSDPLVVATSLVLPDGNGFELLDYVHEKIPGTPSLVFSNYGYDILGESVLLHGAKKYFCRREIDRLQESIMDFANQALPASERPFLHRLLYVCADPAKAGVLRAALKQRRFYTLLTTDLLEAQTKLMSRFGRNYLQVGMYTEMLFPEYGVHFIAVNDGVDSVRGDSEFTAIRNVFNEMYAKDTSKKIRATWQSKGRSGEHLTTIPPYGYKKDPEDKKRWIVDEEAAAIVQKIFALCMDGLGPTQITKWLQKNKVLNPTAYAYDKGLPVSNKPPVNPYKWTNETVSRILERLDYLGHTVNFKTTKQSFKSKKKLWNDPSEWVIFENTQEPIIEESVFLIVQKIRQGRRRPTKMGDMGMFSGLLYCADCGGKMYLCRTNYFKPEQEYYICSTYRKDRTLCTTHSIRRVVLEEIVLRNLREAIQYVTQYEDDFVQRAADQSLRERDKELAQKKDTLTQSQKRIAELDVIIKRLYEDNISGKLSDERFIKLSRDYELEQTNLTNLVEHLRKEVKEQEKQKVNVRQFIAAVRKYTDMQQLDASVLREFVEKIYISEVYTPDENEPRIKVREIEIVYNFIGAFDFEEAREQSQAAQKEKKTGVA